MALSLWQTVLVGWALVAAMMLALYLVQLKTRDAGIVDVGWAGGMALLAVFYLFALEGYGPRKWLVGLMGAVWGARLALYLLFNRVLSGGEDGRYAALRNHWGKRAQPLFFVFFQLQASWAILFAFPLLIIMRRPEDSLLVQDWIGLAVWVVAVGGEALADRQLARFRADPSHRGKTCRVGLWRYSRHPNYFFEWIHWWAYCVMAIGAPYGWITLMGPVVMLVFLYRITGIPYTEKQAIKSRGEDYRRYQRETSAFIPWPPRKG